MQDAQTAAAAAKTLADAWSSVGDSITTEINRIRGLTGTDASGGFAQLLGQFNVANTAARGGDQDAAKSLPGLSQALLTAAAASATSRQELDRIQAQTAASLEVTNAAIKGLAGVVSTATSSTTSNSAFLDAAGVVQSAQAAPAAANDDLVQEVQALRAEIVQMRADNNTGHATISYALGAHVIKAATHRVYESAKAANVGNDPAGASGLWIDVGPTKRWAMFDQALGTASTATRSIEVNLTAGTVQAVALLDVVATAVRVRSTGYDRTIAVGAGAVSFADSLVQTNGSITDLALVVSDADHALAQSITDLGTTFDGKLSDTAAAITVVQEAVSDESAARATAITDLTTSFTNSIGEAVDAAVTTFNQAISSETEARAQAITDLSADFTTALGTAIGAAVTNFGLAIADETEARAEQYGLVTARLDKVGGGTASVEQLFSAQADALGNLSARASLAVTAGGVWSGITVTAADGSAGTLSDITMSAMTINVSTAKLIFNNGAVMKVLGTGFGVGNEFIDWFGPSMPFAQCSRANGTVWQTVSGDAYFGGSLSAGALTNGANSSSVAPDVVADTGGFGSDGGKITVVMSWTYTWTFQAAYAATTDGVAQFDAEAANYAATNDGNGNWFGSRVETGSPTLTLAREIGGASRIDVAPASINPGVGTFQGRRPIPGAGNPGAATLTARWSASLTYTDPDHIVSDRRFLATLARGFSAFSGLVSQRVTIITTEE